MIEAEEKLAAADAVLVQKDVEKDGVGIVDFTDMKFDVVFGKPPATKNEISNTFYQNSRLSEEVN